MDPLIFEMGLYKALIPQDRLYSETHFWFQVQEDGRTRCGLTAYAARLLTDLFRLDWIVKTGDMVELDQVLGEVESTKAVSELYSPIGGELIAVNSAAVIDPSMLGVAPYDTWLFEFNGLPESALTAPDYVTFLAAGWDDTVRMLKGQV